MVRLPLQFYPEARNEALEAYDWYARRSHKAAKMFYAELQDAGRPIQHDPERWSDYLLGTRRYLMKRFPFVVVYRVVPDRIEIVAIAHGRRRPAYWKTRLDAE